MKNKGDQYFGLMMFLRILIRFSKGKSCVYIWNKNKVLRLKRCVLIKTQTAVQLGTVAVCSARSATVLFTVMQ